MPIKSALFDYQVKREELINEQLFLQQYADADTKPKKKEEETDYGQELSK